MNILFKAKTLDTGEWVEGHLVQNPCTSYIIPTGWETSMDLDAKEIDFKTLGQYIGKEDKEGVKIFNHDTVDFVLDGKQYKDGEIVWENYGWHIQMPPLNGLDQVERLAIFGSDDLERTSKIHNN